MLIDMLSASLAKSGALDDAWAKLIRGRMLRWAWLLLLVRFWLRRVLRLTPGLRL